MENYRYYLKRYIDTQDESALYQAEQLSKLYIQNKISPEEIINKHIQALKDLFPHLPKEIDLSMNFLLETMISYGLAYQEHQSMRKQQLSLRSEMELAANMQQTLLLTETPNIKGLDIGAVSVPAKQLNGDYYHFSTDKNGRFGVAIADVIGKGMPAALAMSMIKYSVDSFSDHHPKPSSLLEKLNRVVENNVEPGMFITMLYGLYNPITEKFMYATAGHEPGFFYDATKNEFTEIEGRGLVLGVSDDTTYQEYELALQDGDIIFLLTDGVTECRIGDRFIERQEVLEVIKHYMHLPAQTLVEKVYKHFERLQEFQLRDDFTLIMIRKQV
ncbi:PP2C family protein-serine/threonine phosphatase [Aquibacillus sediminis]|uniref:PP2C family protein-serine/threonine phosphatase n=1 Tax=Aquibacillus sediminis TaxID=2574734 RepID=UPI001107A9C0|nr:PP2C family protein-serine/threonine phosphatase [Aquibacillus sediminis]